MGKSDLVVKNGIFRLATIGLHMGYWNFKKHCLGYEAVSKLKLLPDDFSTL